MRIGPFEFGKASREHVRCFSMSEADLENYDDKNLETEGLVGLEGKIRKRFEDEGVEQLGLDVGKGLWCVEDPTGKAELKEFFAEHGLEAEEIDPEAGKQFGRWFIKF